MTNMRISVKQISEVVQELLLNAFSGGRGGPSGPSRGPPSAAQDWQTKVTDDDAESRKDPDIWEAYDY